jgi:hypothetical protein
LIGTALHGPFIGYGVYSTTAAGESKKISVARGHKGTFYVDIQNDGLLASAVTVSGSAGAHGFSVTYFRGATNVTASVRAGTYSTGNLAADQHQTLKVVVKVAAGSAKSGTFLIKAKWLGSTDAVKAIVKAI